MDRHDALAVRERLPRAQPGAAGARGAASSSRSSCRASGRLELEAETAYQLLPDIGMIFHATRKSDREAIAAFVTGTLLS